MDRANFEKCVAVTLAYEGGNSDDPRDPGGRTSRGITQREWDSYRRANPQPALPADVFDAPQSAILDIYWSQYWNPVAGDGWPAGLNLCTFDAGVNSGLGRSLTWSRAVLGQGTGTFVLLASLAAAAADKVALIHDFQARRLAFLEGLPIWSTFKRGWSRRVAGVEALATKWALQATGQPVALVSLSLDSQARRAATKAQVSAVLAFILAVVPPWLHYIADQHLDWVTAPLHATIYAATFFVVAALSWYAHKHNVRKLAFRKVMANVDDTALIHYLVQPKSDSASPANPRLPGATKLNAESAPLSLPSQVTTVSASTVGAGGGKPSNAA